MSNFVTDYLLNCVFCNTNFDSVFLSDCNQFFSVFLDYVIGNLMRIPKMCLKLRLDDSKWVL